MTLMSYRTLFIGKATGVSCYPGAALDSVKLAMRQLYAMHRIIVRCTCSASFISLTSFSWFIDLH